MEAPRSLTPEQKSTLGTVFHFIEMSLSYLGSVAPIAEPVDRRLLEALIELGEMCRRRLPQNFPELLETLIELGEDWKKRGCAMTHFRKTRCAVARCPHCSWVQVFFGTDRFELKLRAVMEQVFHAMTAHKDRRGGL